MMNNLVMFQSCQIIVLKTTWVVTKNTDRERKRPDVHHLFDSPHDGHLYLLGMKDYCWGQSNVFHFEKQNFKNKEKNTKVRNVYWNKSIAF